jgi:hypothetical protein
MQFASFVRALIVEGQPGVSLRVGSDSRRREVATLLEALDAYCWCGESFAAINAKIESMRQEMEAALTQCQAAQGTAERRLAELELLFVSNKSLSWGRVYEGAFPFLIHQAETGVLSQNLRSAAALIDGTADDVGAFDDRPYRSDCAMTKVYAMMNQRTVVYDDRLGAALGLLCRKHLERERRRSVPELLAFMVGDRGDVRHDPSRRDLVFGDKRSGSEHARWNIRANWLVDRLARDETIAAALGSHHRDRIRRLEAALFMIGDDVQDQPRTVVSAPARAPRRVTEPASSAAGEGSSSS